MRRVRLSIAALCIVVGLGLFGVQPWAEYVTAHGRQRALWRASLPGFDLGIDALPAAPGQDGVVELWAYPHDADDYWPLVQVFGASALPLASPISTPAPVAPSQPPLKPKLQPERLPGELWT